MAGFVFALFLWAPTVGHLGEYKKISGSMTLAECTQAADYVEKVGERAKCFPIGVK